MLMSQQRTADAVIVTPARLLELDRRGLDELESKSPKLCTAVMRKLAVHIANRPDLATGLVRTLQRVPSLNFELKLDLILLRPHGRTSSSQIVVGSILLVY